MTRRASYTKPRRTADAELIIHGTVYDITNFNHPGGSIIMGQVNPPDAGFPADATIAFDTMHGSSNKPMKELARLRGQGKSRKLSDEEAALMKEKRPYDKILDDKYHMITERFRRAGVFDYKLSHFLVRNAQIMALCFLGAWCAVEPGEYLGYWTGCLMMGLCMQQVGWLQHDRDHRSSATDHPLNFIAGTFWFGMGLSGPGRWWRRSQQHHSDHLQRTTDVETDTIPIENDGLTPSAGGGALWLEQFNESIMGMSTMDAFFLGMHWFVWFMFFGPRIGYQEALFFHILSSFLEAPLIFIHVLLSPTTTAFRGSCLREHWVEQSLRRSVDIHSHSKVIGPFFGPIVDYIVDHFMGYLNYPIIHQLWPQMPHQHQMSPVVLRGVQELCEAVPELEMQYRVMTYMKAMNYTLANVGNVSKEHVLNGLNNDFQPIATEPAKQESAG